MNTILTELYEAFKPSLMSPEEIEALQQGAETIERVEKQLSEDDFEGIWEVLSHLNNIQAGESFALGFRLGARLMLEVTKECPSYGRR